VALLDSYTICSGGKGIMELSLGFFGKWTALWMISSLFFGFPVFSKEKQSEVYFNHSDTSTYQDPYRRTFRDGDDLEAVIIKHIQSAQTSIDIAVQELRLPLVSRELVKKHKQGVSVRVVLENTYNHDIKQWVDQSKEGFVFPEAYGTTRMLDYVALIDVNKDKVLSHEELLENDAVYMLNHYKIPLIDDTADGSKGSALMHHKFMVIDGKTTLVTSANFTLSDIHGKILDQKTKGNANALIVFYRQDIASVFLEEFNIMFGGLGKGTLESHRFGLQKPYRGPQAIQLSKNQKIEIQFSPTSKKRDLRDSTAGLINKALSTAKKTIDIALFVFSDQYISDHLKRLVEQKNLQISAMIDSVFAFRYYSEGLDLLGLSWRAPNCRFTPGNNPWTKSPVQNVGAPKMDSSDKLHHKFAVIDDKKVIFGSKNWTHAGNFLNNETVMIIEDKAIALAFKNEIQRWQNRTNWGVPYYLQKRAQEHEVHCRAQGHP